MSLSARFLGFCRDAIGNFTVGAALALTPWKIQLEPRSGLNHALLAIFVNLVIIGLLDYLAVLGDGEVFFNAHGAMTIGSILFVSLLVAIALCGLHSSYDKLPGFLCTLTVTLPILVVAMTGFKDFGGEFSEVDALWFWFLIWGVLIVFRSISITFEDVNPVSYWVVIGTVGIVLTYSTQTYLSVTTFIAYDSESDAYYKVDQEEIYYKQRHLLEQRVERLLPEQPAMTDIYYLGFAGSGDEAVFRREVIHAQNELNRRYPIEARSLVLSSSTETLEVLPMATTYNLDESLRNLGEIMNVEEDVLFLFLTSHGGKDASLSVSFYPFTFRDLTSDMLRNYLDAAGIKWRVIVISACYSGSFIDALADDYTLILTAASSDTTSFGCSDTREMTYFGEALFTEGFRDGRNIVDAFEIAKTAVSRKESTEQLEPSRPQMYLGERMRLKLEEIDF